MPRTQAYLKLVSDDQAANDYGNFGVMAGLGPVLDQIKDLKIVSNSIDGIGFSPLRQNLSGLYAYRKVQNTLAGDVGYTGHRQGHKFDWSAAGDELIEAAKCFL